MKSIKTVAITMVAFCVAMSIVVSTAGAEKVKVSVASSSAGAAAYVMWGGLAALVSKESKTVEMSNLTTRGTVEDLRLIEAGKSEFGAGVSTLIINAQKGVKPYDKKYVKIRGIGPATAALFHIVTRKDANITTLSQLDGKRWSFARKGSTTHYLSSLITKYAGLEVHKETMNWNVAADAIKDGRLDAFSLPTPPPAPAVVKAASMYPISLISVDDEVLAKVRQENPAYFKGKIPAGTYEGVDKDVYTVGYVAWTVASADVPDDVVYEVTRINYSAKGRDFLSKVHKGWNTGFAVTPSLDVMESIGLKIHPGAARYWEEQGYKIPDSIR